MRKLVRFGFWGLVALLPLNCSLDDRVIERASSVRPGAEGQGIDPGEAPLEGGPRLAVNTPAVDFGNVTVGFPSRARVILRNDGAAPLLAPSVARSSGSSADFQVIQNQCGAELAPGEACEVRVQFVPSSAAPGQARLDIGSANGGSATVELSGLGLVGGDLILAPAFGSFEDFGGVNLGSVVEGRFTVSNPLAESSGPLTFSVNRPDLSLLPPAAGDCTPGVSALADGQSCDVRVAFAPLERGLGEGTLTATSPAGGSVSLTLAGRGLLQGVLSPSIDALDFGGVVLQQSGQSALRFENTGDQPLTLGGARLEPVEATQFSILDSDCADGMALAGGVSCGVQLQYRPTAIGVEDSAELVLDVAGGEPLRLPLSGRGLQAGALALSAVDAAAGPDFGDVLVGETRTHGFVIANPGQQPSGVLSLSASGGFQIVTPPEGTDCVDGSTSLATGESCTVRVSLVPAERQSLAGALTVSSALAGASSLALTARAVLGPSIDVVSQLDFGRVLTNAFGVRTITIRNAGDLELPVPSIDVVSDSPAQQAAFVPSSTCSAPLAFDQTCDVSVTWTPTEPVPHSANLRIVAEPGDTASVLLLGQALSPGSLVLAVADAAGPDFGDVPLGATATRSFVLTNPGNEPSGRITVSSDDNHFSPSLGDCNTGSPDGLVDGSACTFSVVFTPDGSEALVANLTVQSPGAGRTGVEVRGRGRAPATLTATGNRDLGRARIGQAALTEPANSFAWTVNNDGDLPTAALLVESSNGAEFVISGDTCSTQALAGHSSCEMAIRFVPAEPPGMRQASITVTEGAGGSAATVALTGLAVRLAQPGQPCINAECATGVCTGGVCCDVACDQTCQVCSAAGVCQNQANQEPCGTGGARCFGVNECKLPADAPCGGPDDCGGDLLCKACTNGGSRCTAPAGCCGPCPGSTSCQNGTCGCAADEVECGNNLCIPTDRNDVCCPVSPRCPGGIPQCRNDGQCVQCLDDSHCTCGACVNNTCQPRPRGSQDADCTPGQLCNGTGGCFQPQCTPQNELQACGQCGTCQDFQCVPRGEGASCDSGVCTASGDCVQCIENIQCRNIGECIGNRCLGCPLNSLQNNSTCCVNTCGMCGGAGCSQREGGTDGCCSDRIQATAPSCAESGAPPCVLR